jgi:hypothetical protein
LEPLGHEPFFTKLAAISLDASKTMLEALTQMKDLLCKSLMIGFI